MTQSQTESNGSKKAQFGGRRAEMRRPFLAGERIYLRALEESDVSGPYLDWLNDYEVTRYLETGSFPTTEDALQKYVRTIQTPNNVMLAIIEKESGAHVGNIKLGSIQGTHRRADVGILIGDKRAWGKGYGHEATELMLEYGFRRLNLHKITLGVYADHEGAVKSYQKLGFAIEGTLREHLFRDGTFHDEYVMGILRADYEKMREGKSA